ncbi:MAG: replication-associated recombination protein A, partial [Planctomycetes bacterium]|nr:replication-associated recombination protein A [Planctomycetota bacterium]
DLVIPHDPTHEPDSVEYLGVDRVYYQPSDRGLEMEIRRRAASVKTRAKSLKEDEPPELPG